MNGPQEKNDIELSEINDVNKDQCAKNKDIKLEEDIGENSELYSFFNN